MFRIETWNDTVTIARQETFKFRALSMLNSNLVVVFYLHAIILGISAVVAVLETQARTGKFILHVVPCTKGTVQTFIKQVCQFVCGRMHSNARSFKITGKNGIQIQVESVSGNTK